MKSEAIEFTDDQTHAELFLSDCVHREKQLLMLYEKAEHSNFDSRDRERSFTFKREHQRTLQFITEHSRTQFKNSDFSKESLFDEFKVFFIWKAQTLCGKDTFLKTLRDQEKRLLDHYLSVLSQDNPDRIVLSYIKDTLIPQQKNHVYTLASMATPRSA